MHGVHIPVFVCSPYTPFTHFAHFRKFACPPSHTCIHMCICSLTQVCTHTLSCTHTMLTSIHTYTHSNRTQFTYSFSLTPTFTHLHVHLSLNTQTTLSHHMLRPWATSTCSPTTHCCPSLPAWCRTSQAIMLLSWTFLVLWKQGPFPLHRVLLPEAVFPQGHTLRVLGLWAFAQLVPSARCPAN